MATTEFHVTAVRNASVYGHETTHCSEAGCNGDEMYLGDTQAIQAHKGDIVEIELGDNHAGSLTTQAAIRRGENVAKGN